VVPRVLLISDRYFPHVGGSIHWFQNIYSRRPPGTVSILTQQYPDAATFDLAHPELDIVRRKLERYPFLRPESLLLYFKLWWTGASIIRRRKIELIHASKVLPEGLVARRLARRFRIPYVVFAHGEEITIFGKHPRQRRQLPRVYDDAAAVIANSRFTASKLLEVGCRGENIARISPGVDTDVFTPGTRDPAIVDALGLAGKKVLLSVGRLTKRKGHDRVIDALPALLARHPETVWVVLSSGEEETNLRRRAQELGVASHVRFVGEVRYEQLPAYYRSADVFVLANRELEDGDMEGFGIVFLEANACGRPVIAGNSGGTGDPVRDGVNGFRIDATDPRNIAAAVARVFDDPRRGDEMGARGREIVTAEYTWDRVVERVEELGRRVVTGTVDESAERLIAQR